MLVLALTGTVVALQSTLVVPLLPDLPRLLGTTAEGASWLVTATLLAGAVATPILSRLADMFGKRRMMLVALTVMTAGSMLGGFTQHLPLLIVARALQGVGTALIPIGVAIIRDELPARRIPLGVALMSGTMALGTGVGLSLGGITVEHLPWRDLFWVVTGMGLIMTVAVRLVLPESPIRTGGRFDIGGALLLSGALIALLLALSKISHWGWGRETMLLILLGIVMLSVWVPLELRMEHPLVNVRLATQRRMVLVNAAAVLVGFAMYSNMLVSSQLLQVPVESGYGLGVRHATAGLAMTPSALAFGFMAPVAAWGIRRFGPQPVMAIGCVIIAGTYSARIIYSDDLAQIVIGSVVVACGTSMAFAAMPAFIIRTVPITETASANGLNTLLRTVGMSGSSATTAAVSSIGLVSVLGVAYPSLQSLMWMFALSGAAALIAALFMIPGITGRGVRGRCP